MPRCITTPCIACTTHTASSSYAAVLTQRQEKDHKSGRMVRWSGPTCLTRGANGRSYEYTTVSTGGLSITACP